MAKRRLLPGIEVLFNEEELSFLCDGEPIEDMEFTWDDFDDTELLREVADELVEYVDIDEIDELQNPRAGVVKKLIKLRDASGGSSEEDYDEEDDDDEDDDD